MSSALKGLKKHARIKRCKSWEDQFIWVILYDSYNMTDNLRVTCEISKAEKDAKIV